jgi:hypothetical protein
LQQPWIWFSTWEGTTLLLWRTGFLIFSSNTKPGLPPFLLEVGEAVSKLCQSCVRMSRSSFASWSPWSRPRSLWLWSLS